MTEQVLVQVLEAVTRYKGDIDARKIQPRVRWDR